MGGPAISFLGAKIKGGAWTVFKFFILSVAYTSVWLAVSSELGYYRSLYGPQVLLHLNIAYYVPSIPILVFQSFFDERLEASFGISRTILARLVFSLVGYAAVSAWFPFMPQRIDLLLATVVALGTFSSIAFSSSYQMVARFANKNVIALGLGCTASGPLILLLQIGLGMKATPTQKQQIILYLSIACLVLAGLWAAVSLLWRHWDAIDASSSRTADHSIQEPLLPSEASGDAGELGLPLAGGSPRMQQIYQHQQQQPGSAALVKHTSLPPALAYSLLEPYEQPFLTAHGDWSPATRRRTTSPGTTTASTRGRRTDSTQDLLEGDGFTIPRSSSAPGEWFINRWGSDEGPEGANTGGQIDGGAGNGLEGEDAGEEEEGDARLGDVEGGVSGMVEATRMMWPALVAIGTQSGIALTLFPFFTYLPSSGLLGEDLPKILFFSRIFADIAGRMLPRAKIFVPASIVPVLAVAACKLAAEPLFFVYLQTSDKWHSDILACVYVVLMWAASGYVNTAANMVAPRMVPPHMRSTAAALMAITYQVGHFVGLSLAVALAYLMYGHIGADD